MRLLSNIIGNPNDKTSFRHELLLTNTKFANLRKVFARKSSTEKLLKKYKMIQSGGFLGRLLGSLLKTVLPLMKTDH